MRSIIEQLKVRGKGGSDAAANCYDNALETLPSMDGLE